MLMSNGIRAMNGLVQMILDRESPITDERVMPPCHTFRLQIWTLYITGISVYNEQRH